MDPERKVQSNFVTRPISISYTSLKSQYMHRQDQIERMESAFKKHLFKVAELEESLNSEKATDDLTDEER